MGSDPTILHFLEGGVLEGETLLPDGGEVHRHHELLAVPLDPDQESIPPPRVADAGPDAERVIVAVDHGRLAHPRRSPGGSPAPPAAPQRAGAVAAAARHHQRLRRHLAEEARRLPGPRVAPRAPLGGPGQEEATLRPREPDVGEAPLLLD